MSVREEDRQKNCPSRGLGIAAAAIGVGVGAALYYFFNKRQDNPDISGSTSNWTYDEPQALQHGFQEDSIVTISDTSTIEDDNDDTNSDKESSETEQGSNLCNITISDTSLSDTSLSDMSVSNTSSDISLMTDELNTSNTSGESYMTISEHSTSDTSMHDTSHSLNTSLITSQDNGGSYSPSEPRTPRSIEFITRALTSMLNTGTSTSREREWRLEECSICFESMQRDQEVMALPCSHRFHQPCILPWLQERQNCPNCRKQA